MARGKLLQLKCTRFLRFSKISKIFQAIFVNIFQIFEDLKIFKDYGRYQRKFWYGMVSEDSWGYTSLFELY